MAIFLLKTNKILAKFMMVRSIITVKQAIKVLEAWNWIEIRQVEELGTVNVYVYVIKDRAVWTQSC